MSRYDWPHVTRQEIGGDDPDARGRLMRRIRTDFDPEGARAASLAAQAPHPHPGRSEPFAPPTGRQHLWQPLGPFIVLRGQAIGDPRIAGRVNMLAVDMGGKRVYAASANGGVWYTSDGGVTWKSLGGFAVTTGGEIIRPAQRHTCGSIAVSFGLTEATDFAFVGTGEHTHPRDAQPGHSLGGIGILFADHPATTGGDNPWTREAKNLIGRGVCRIAIQPSPGLGVVAATTIGLLQRPGPGVDNVWNPVAGSPFSSLTDKCSDVLWTKGGGARPERLWVWVQDGDNAGLWVRAAGATDFTKIDTPGADGGRGVLAAAAPPDQIFLFNNRGSSANPLLFRIACATAATPVATQVVAGVPNVLKTQGFYDIALAVHPVLANRVVVGGSTFNATTPDGTPMNSDAGVVVGDVGPGVSGLTFGPPAAAMPSTMIGVGAHADVHDLAYSNSGDRLWLACDGGVFRSDKPRQQVGFFPVNDGLSICEANYIANHPSCEGYVVAGLQDNGVIGRRSTGVWKVEGGGDGGGVAFDPIRPDRYVRQYVQGTWWGSDGSIGVLPFAKETAAFYSMPAAIAHRRGVVPPPVPNVGQIIVGTSRVWYSEDFGKTWKTLPTGSAPPAGNTAQDDFGEPIRVCRWQSPDVAWILSEGILQRYARTPGSDAATAPGAWTRALVIKKGVKNKKDETSADGPIRDSDVWTDVAVNLDSPPAAGQPPAQHGTLGAVYLGTIGKADDDKVDTLWWFDGTSKWYATGLRKNVVPAPVTAVACDPAQPDEVWVGTTVGVWRGVRTLHGSDPPTWVFEARVNGLPEAAVEDLAIFNDGAIRLLRAGIASRGVWELRLDVADLTDLTYLRAHDDDLRYRARAVEKKRDLVTDRSWHGSPDVRPRRAPLPRTAPASLPWRRTSAALDAEALRRFQCALRARTNDPRVRPTGVWDSYFNEVLRDLGAPMAASPAPANTVSIDDAFWTLSMHSPFETAEAWGPGVPSEADLYDFSAQLSEGDLMKASCALPGGALKVEIVVHHRGLDPVNGANVRVTLLTWIDPQTKNAAKFDDHTTWVAGNVSWTAAVNQVLNSADGKTALAVGSGWSFVLGNNTESHRITLDGQMLDPMHAGIATFDLTLPKTPKNQLVLLVAVIRVGTTPADDIALAPATLQDLALTSPNVAVRSVQANPHP